MKFRSAFLLSVFAFSGGSYGDTGYKVGDVSITPSLGVKGNFDDNVYSARNNKQRDFFATISPGLALKLLNSKHTLNLGAGLDHNKYKKESRNNYTNYHVNGFTRYMFDGSTFWDFSGLVRRLHSTRSNDIGTPINSLLSPIEYDHYRGLTSFYHRIDDFTFRPRVEANKYVYQNGRRFSGALFDQRGRNREEFAFGGEVGYNVDSSFKVFVDLEGEKLNYKQAGDTNRSAKGGAYLLGGEYRPSKDFLFRVAGGYMNRSWDKNIYRDLKTWKGQARLDWIYQPEALIRLSFDRAISEITDRGASSAVRSDFNALVKHPVMEELFVNLRFRYARYDFKGGRGATFSNDDRLDHLYDMGAGLEYKFNSHVSFDTRYTYRKNKSNILSSNYEGNTVLVGVKFTFGE